MKHSKKAFAPVYGPPESAIGINGKNRADNQRENK